MKILFAFCFLAIFSCSPTIEEVEEVADKAVKIMTETGTDVEITFTENAEPSIKILADKAVRYNVEEPYTEFPEGFKLLVYDELGVVESILTANFGKMNDGSTQMIAEDDVVVVNESGEKLNTEYLIWDQEAKKIKSEGFVKITTPDEIIYGNGFESNDNFTDYTIFQITGTVQVEDESL